jgi:hypothetical protein
MPDEKKDLTEEEIREWLKKSSLRKFNIFNDQNQIIKRLCIALLKAKGLNPFK